MRAALGSGVKPLPMPHSRLGRASNVLEAWAPTPPDRLSFPEAFVLSLPVFPRSVFFISLPCALRSGSFLFEAFHILETCSHSFEQALVHCPPTLALHFIEPFPLTIN